MSTTHTLVLPSTFDSIERIVTEAESFFGSHYSDEEYVYKLQLLASEAVTNGINHGNHYDESKSVTVVFSVRGTDAMISVEDEGEGFVRKDVDEPMQESNMLSFGGRGLFLMESMSDEVRYDKGGRRVTLVIKNEGP